MCGMMSFNASPNRKHIQKREECDRKERNRTYLHVRIQLTPPPGAALAPLSLSLHPVYIVRGQNELLTGLEIVCILHHIVCFLFLF